jgi:hypothetical protein
MLIIQINSGDKAGHYNYYCFIEGTFWSCKLQIWNLKLFLIIIFGSNRRALLAQRTSPAAGRFDGVASDSNWPPTPGPSAGFGPHFGIRPLLLRPVRTKESMGSPGISRNIFIWVLVRVACCPLYWQSRSSFPDPDSDVSSAQAATPSRTWRRGDPGLRLSRARGPIASEPSNLVAMVTVTVAKVHEQQTRSTT